MNKEKIDCFLSHFYVHFGSFGFINTKSIKIITLFYIYPFNVVSFMVHGICHMLEVIISIRLVSVKQFWKVKRGAELNLFCKKTQ